MNFGVASPTGNPYGVEVPTRHTTSPYSSYRERSGYETFVDSLPTWANSFATVWGAVAGPPSQTSAAIAVPTDAAVVRETEPAPMVDTQQVLLVGGIAAATILGAVVLTKVL